LLAVVSSLLSLSDPVDFEVVVVDNGSTDDGVLAVSRLRDERLRIVAEPRLGLSYARSAGVRSSRAETVVFVDDDNYLSASYLSLAEEVMAANPAAAAAGGVAEPVSDDPLPAWFDGFSQFYGCGPQGSSPGVLPPASFLRGAGLVIRRRSWNEFENARGGLGLTDRKGSSLSTGGDAELCFALQLLGYDLVYDPRLSLRHEMTAGRLCLSYLGRLAFHNGRASAVLDAYVGALIGWRPRSWKRALMHELRPSLAPASPLSVMCGLGWRFGRLREIAKLRDRYGALPELVSPRGSAT
jgi:glycosyltransferase involved in cell wall biosynthesis